MGLRRSWRDYRSKNTHSIKPAHAKSNLLLIQPSYKACNNRKSNVEQQHFNSAFYTASYSETPRPFIALSDKTSLSLS
ncbi:MAG: hypothetical protein JO297_18745 [Nitrososphaeraceae archaeon]|nr:hypothetical protein [Nitrososphaeraceae archaeon]